MTELQQDESPESPGRRRTWWHPLLVQTFDWILREAYEVQGEVNVGRMPLQVDIVLLRRKGDVSEMAQRELAPLLPLLNEYTLIEFKSSADSLEVGDLSHFFGCVDLFHSQQRPPLARGALSAANLAPALSTSLRDDAERIGLTIHPRNPGVWEVTGWLYPLWLLETDRLAETVDTALTLFSRVFLRDAPHIMGAWEAIGRTQILQFLYQQIEQFKTMEAFAMQHKDAPVMDQTWDEFRAHVLTTIPAEERLQGLTAEEIVQAMDERQRDRLRQLLDQPRAPESHDQEEKAQ